MVFRARCLQVSFIYFFFVSYIFSWIDSQKVFPDDRRLYLEVSHITCPSPRFPVYVYKNPVTVEIFLTNSSEISKIVCKLMLSHVDLEYEKEYIHMNITKHSRSEKNSDKLVLEIMESGTGQKHIFNTSVLENSIVNFVSYSTHLRMELTIENPSATFLVVLRAWIARVIHKIQPVKLSENSGYITSMDFDGFYNYRRDEKRGEFQLDTLQDESIFTAFTHFVLSTQHICSDFVELQVPITGQKWKLCGRRNMSPQLYQHSIKLVYQRLVYSLSSSGFKMVYAIVARSEEPQLVSDWKYNCSVPHFGAFRPVLSCNMLVECVEAEDEQNCSFHTAQCGRDMIDAETKCYKLFRNTEGITWYDAKSRCHKHNMSLVTLATPREHAYFLKTVHSIRNFTGVFVGVRLLDHQQPLHWFSLYTRFIWRWVDGRTAFNIQMQMHYRFYYSCAQHIRGFRGIPNIKIGYYPDRVLNPVPCYKKAPYDILCERQIFRRHLKVPVLQLNTSQTTQQHRNLNIVQCPGNHVTRDFLSCDVKAWCGSTERRLSCRTKLSLVQVPMFACRNSRQTVHFTLVCDHVQHCSDKSDEDFCNFMQCHWNQFTCKNKQCILREKVCDDTADCYDNTDEFCSNQEIYLYLIRNGAPSVVNMREGTTERKYSVEFKRMNDTSDCPPTHFLCPRSDCLPVYFRCNNVDDCPGREDEAGCETYTCAGFYRCRGSKVCLHPDQLCDSFRQCPQYDDEMLCDPRCPNVCQCQGLAFICTSKFNASLFHDLRFLDASLSGMSLDDLAHKPFLVHLNLSRCNIDHLTTAQFPNLRLLDLSWNQLSYVDLWSFNELSNLLVLILSSNPLSLITNSGFFVKEPLHVDTLDLSNTTITLYNGSVFNIFPSLTTLNMSYSKVVTITDGGFNSTPSLETFDARYAPLLKFPFEVFKQLDSLTEIYTDNYKLCCKRLLPSAFDAKNCHTKHDVLSSCEDLLRSNAYRSFLWIFAFLAVVGNIGSIVGRIYLNKGSKRSDLGSFSVFVSSLCLADCLMGVYLIVIGVSDLVYLGNYVLYDEQWKNSKLCSFAGFLSLVSSEVSAFMICLITLDRFLVIRFPFSQWHFKFRCAVTGCAVVWIFGLMLATVPLLPVTSHWDFFSQTGICTPLPFVSSERFPGYSYSFSVTIVLNFVLFLLIACGQLAIYWSMRASSVDSSSKDTTVRDATVARRLTTIVVTDFLCWFPVGLLGVLASTGVVVPSEVNVGVAVFVLPLNSALNPFLYTFNTLKEKRRRLKEERLLKQLETRLAINQIRTWLKRQVILEQDIESLTETG